MLERRIAARLPDAAVDDLLIPSYSYLVGTLYDMARGHTGQPDAAARYGQHAEPRAGARA